MYCKNVECVFISCKLLTLKYLPFSTFTVVSFSLKWSGLVESPKKANVDDGQDCVVAVDVKPSIGEGVVTVVLIDVNRLSDEVDEAFGMISNVEDLGVVSEAGFPVSEFCSCLGTERRFLSCLFCLVIAETLNLFPKVNQTAPQTKITSEFSFDTFYMRNRLLCSSF